MHDRTRWDHGLKKHVSEINELTLQLLRASAEALDGADQTSNEPPLISGLRRDWQALDGAALQRLARCPYVLIDAGFAAPNRWDAVSVAGSTQGRVMDGGAMRGYFGGPAGIALLRRTLSLAWHVARSNPLNARMMLGMSGECADRIGASGLMHLEALAELSPAWIAPRWEAQPLIWRQMIGTAIGGSDAALRRVQLRGLQLMAALW